MIMKRIVCIFICLCCIACGKESISTSSLKGWYTDLSSIARTSSFNRINQAIASNECIYTTGYSHDYDYYATPELFFDDNGMWNSSDAHYGTCRFLPNPGCYISAINILNKNTIVVYFAHLWKPDKVSGQSGIVGRVYAGPYFGELVYYSDSPRYYSYTVLDNKLVVSNGDIYTVTSNGLIKDGSNVLLSKYDPSQIW